jgi:competence protein ComEC
MPVFALGFVAGTWLLQQGASLPEPGLLLALGCVSVLLLMRRGSARLALSGAAAGLAYAGAQAALDLSVGRLPDGLEGRELTVEGRVVSLPAVSDDRYRFDLQVERLPGELDESEWAGRIRLSWYRAERAPPRSGERWRLRVKLKRPHGFMNPGGFDYEGWLFQQSIAATGYVRRCDCNRRIDESLTWWDPGVGRQYIRDRINERIADPGARSLIAALTVGDRSGMASAHWTALRRTGTSHLVAISGLHVGMVAALAYLLIGKLWRRAGGLMLRVPAPSAGAAAGMFAALVYAGLAGFSIPTQRALVMVAAALGSIVLRRRAQPARLLALALLSVLILDPYGVCAAGLWLSFGAVAILVYALASRVGEVAVWARWSRAQWYLALGMAPLVIGWFEQTSLIAPLVNWIAVPWFSLVLVPVSLLSALVLVLDLGVGLVLPLAGLLAGTTVRLLEWAASLPLAAVQTTETGPWVLGLAGVGVLVLLAPWGLPSRWLGAVLCLPLLTFRPDSPPHAGFELTLLDVGQGLSAVVRTRGHVLVFDAGPRYSGRFDSGRDLLAPYLSHAGVGHVDLLVLSHGARDHAGGARGLMGQLPVRRVLSGELVDGLSSEPCRAGHAWQWDGVDFEVLSPPDARWSDNNASCVIRVQGQTASLLLTGDIEREAEARLVERYGERLRTDLVQVPHHGSLTSSTGSFVLAAGAEYALVSSGYRNRFGFPRPKVLGRWRGTGARLLNTAQTGAIRIRAYPGRPLEPELYGESARRYWHDRR